MSGQRYNQNPNSHTIHINKQPNHKRRNREDNKTVFLIAESRGGQINIDLDKYEELITILEDLSNTADLKEKDKHVELTEYIRFHKQYISDTSMDYNYEFRISEREETRNVSHSVYIRGIKQLNLIKQ